MPLFVTINKAAGYSSRSTPRRGCSGRRVYTARSAGRWPLGNARTWDKKGLPASSERFDYECHDGELREFIQPVRHLALQARRVHVVFNNNLRDQGIRGARLFTTLV